MCPCGLTGSFVQKAGEGLRRDLFAAKFYLKSGFFRAFLFWRVKREKKQKRKSIILNILLLPINIFNI